MIIVAPAPLNFIKSMEEAGRAKKAGGLRFLSVGIVFELGFFT